MASGNEPIASGNTIDFGNIINRYNKMQQTVVCQMSSITGQSISGTNPGQFLMLQFQMSKVSQIGDSLSNMISQINQMINNAVRNVKG